MYEPTQLLTINLSGNPPKTNLDDFGGLFLSFGLLIFCMFNFFYQIVKNVTFSPKTRHNSEIFQAEHFVFWESRFYISLIEKKIFWKIFESFTFRQEKILRYTPLVNFTGLNNFSLNVLF